MKRAGILLAAGLLAMSCFPSFAQEATPSSDTNPKDAYYKSLPLLKVWMHRLGYMVQFWNSKSQVSEIFIPLTWFNQGPNSKAEIIYGNEPGYPRLVIFWVDGKFDHVNLYVLNNYESRTWGILSQAEDFTSQFDVQEVPKDF